MPMENALVVAAIVFAFALFGTVLAWADHYTRSRHHDGTPAE